MLYFDSKVVRKAREMAQQLRTLSPLPEDPGLVPRPAWLLEALHECATQTYQQTNLHTHIKEKHFSNKKKYCIF